MPEPPLVNTSPVQQARFLTAESNNVIEGVQEEDKPQEPELPVRAEQRILQQRRQTIMEALQENQQRIPISRKMQLAGFLAGSIRCKRLAQ